MHDRLEEIVEELSSIANTLEGLDKSDLAEW
jgi:hypothetical protein